MHSGAAEVRSKNNPTDSELLNKQVLTFIHRPTLSHSLIGQLLLSLLLLFSGVVRGHGLPALVECMLGRVQRGDVPEQAVLCRLFQLQLWDEMTKGHSVAMLKCESCLGNTENTVAPFCTDSVRRSNRESGGSQWQQQGPADGVALVRILQSVNSKVQVKVKLEKSNVPFRM